MAAEKQQLLRTIDVQPKTEGTLKISEELAPLDEALFFDEHGSFKKTLGLFGNMESRKKDNEIHYLYDSLKKKHISKDVTAQVASYAYQTGPQLTILSTVMVIR